MDKVTVYQFRSYDIRDDEKQCCVIRLVFASSSRRKSTACGIARSLRI
jgi:hypothetical protein